MMCKRLPLGCKCSKNQLYDSTNKTHMLQAEYEAPVACATTSTVSVMKVLLYRRQQQHSHTKSRSGAQQSNVAPDTLLRVSGFNEMAQCIRKVGCASAFQLKHKAYSRQQIEHLGDMSAQESC